MHRVVLCTWSSFFKNACKNGFKVCHHRITSRKKNIPLTSVKEGASKTIDLKEDDPDIIGKMICFCYNHDYDGLVLTLDGENGSLMIHAKMYSIADKYDISLLKDLAKNKFKEDIQGQLRPERLVTLIETVYENTVPSDRGLRDCLTSVLKRYKNELRKDAAFMDLVRSGGDLAVDVIDAWTDYQASSLVAIDKDTWNPRLNDSTYFCHAINAHFTFGSREINSRACGYCSSKLVADDMGGFYECGG